MPAFSSGGRLVASVVGPRVSSSWGVFSLWRLDCFTSIAVDISDVLMEERSVKPDEHVAAAAAGGDGGDGGSGGSGGIGIDLKSNCSMDEKGRGVFRTSI